MPQVSLYLDDTTMTDLRKQAAMQDASLSRYVVRLIKDDIASGWPDGYWDMFGSIDDNSFMLPVEPSSGRGATKGVF